MLSSIRADIITNTAHNMDSQAQSTYPIPEGVYVLPDDQVDRRPDEDVDRDILNPRPISDEKNVWLFWHSGYASMHPYGRRSVRAWHRRFSKQGWAIRVIDVVPGSPHNIANFVEVNETNFPKAFVDGTLGGTYGVQHTSDLVRWPLLLKYGGIYSDVGMIQLGDMDKLWNETIGNPDSPIELISYNCSGIDVPILANYLYAASKNNRLFLRAHKLLLTLWGRDGGKTSTEGMHTDPLISLLPREGAGTHLSFEEDGVVYGPEDVSKMLADYIVQGQACTMAQRTKDDKDKWDGPQYVVDHVYAIEYMIGSQLINEMTAWNGPRQFELMSLPLPKAGETESEDQKQAREIVEACFNKSFGFKLATGLIIRVMGQTLSSLWRSNEGSDDVPGTYAHWLRYGSRYWNQKELPERQLFTVQKPLKVGSLLKD